MSFDPTITLGSILILVGNIGIFLIYIIRMEGKLNLIALRTTNLEQALDALAKTDTRLATFEERIANHGKMLAIAQGDISDLRKGKGFIQNRSSEGIDGSY
jgi:hypothetical protein